MLSEARKRANKRWDKRHKSKMKHYRFHSICRRYIRHEATLSDTRELQDLLNKRIKFLKQG